jgi:hypothetical protein
VRSRLVLLLISLTCVARAAPAARPERAFVVVVANNRSLTPGVAPLHYADDDGARWYELLRPIAHKISLFTVLDEESQRVFRDVVPAVEAPTHGAIFARLAAYNAEMEAARAAGQEPILYFVVVGHGEVAADGEGYVSLLDGPLKRGDLFRGIIAPSKATFNHVIIDACNAWLLVSRRGAADDRGPSGADAIRRYVAGEDLERYPGTGVLLSTSRAQATHEWSVYGGGIFSHQVRSALAGAADVNGDGRIEYSEVRAYVAAANLRIDDPRARLDVFVRPPALDRSRPIVDLATAKFGHYLRLPADAQGRYHLEDARGVRYADFHKSPERPLVIGLVASSYYYLRTGESEARVPLQAPGTIDVSADQLAPRTFAARGAIEETFHRHLFEVPFGPAFYHGFAASAGDAPVESRAPQWSPPALSSAPAGRPELEKRLAAAGDRFRRLGLLHGDDTYGDMLFDWAGGRLRAGDLREAERALATLEGRLSDGVIDRPLVERKLGRIRTRALSAALAPDPAEQARRGLARATDLLQRGDAPGANRALNEVEALLPR